MKNIKQNQPNRKRFRSTIKQVSYTGGMEDIQKQQSIIRDSLIKTIEEIKLLQKERKNQKLP